MSHGILFLYFVVLVLGLISLTSASVITVVTGDIILRYCIFFYSVYTCHIITDVIRYYWMLNMSGTYGQAEPFFHFFEFVIHFLSLYSIAMLIHFLVSIPRQRLINYIFLALCCVTFGTQMYLEGLGKNYGMIRFSGNYSLEFDDIFFLMTIIYMIVVGLLRYKKIEDEQKKIILKKMLIVGILFFPGLVYDSLLNTYDMAIVAPLIYVCISVILFYYLIRFYWRNYCISSVENNDSLEVLFEKYGISEREKDTLMLLLKGYSNRKIGESLYISLSTVKSHIYSAFKKTRVASRYELIHLLKEKSTGPS